MKIKNVETHGDSVFFEFEGTNWTYAVDKEKLAYLLNDELEEFELLCAGHDVTIARLKWMKLLGKGWKYGEVESNNYEASKITQSLSGTFFGGFKKR